MMRRTGNRALEPWTATEAGRGGGSTKSAWVKMSGIAAVLPEKMKGFLNRPVRVGEDHCFCVWRLVTDAMPGRHDEDISLAPLDHNVFTGSRRDHAAAPALDRHKDRRIGRAVGCGCEALRQELDEGSHGSHGVIAGDRVGVAHLEAVAWVPGGGQSQLLKRLAGSRVRIVEYRRGPAATAVIYGKQVMAIAGVAVADRTGDRLFVNVEMLGE